MLLKRVSFDEIAGTDFKSKLSDLYNFIEQSNGEIKGNDSIISLIGVLGISKEEDLNITDLVDLENNIREAYLALYENQELRVKFERIILVIELIYVFRNSANGIDEFDEFDVYSDIASNIVSNDSYTINNKPIVEISNYSYKNISLYITNNSLSVLNLLMLIKFILISDLIEGNNYFIADKSLVAFGQERECIESIIIYRRMELVAEGKSIHNMLEYPNKPKFNCDKDQWSYLSPYIQFNDICTILSEYNYQKSYLDKYLKLYHIFENFMIRSIICESTKTGFNVRHFQNLYNKFETKEKVQLKVFMVKVMNLKYNSTDLFRDVLYQRFHNLEIGHWAQMPGMGQRDNFLKSIGKDNVLSSVSVTNFAEVYAYLLYDIRCSIVHNKETEFHLTSANQNDFIGSELATFYLESMEEIILYLIFNKNSVVWYDKKSVNLY